MPSPKILISEFLDSDALRAFETLPAEVRFEPELWRDPAALAKAVSGVQVLVVRNQTQVTADLLDEALDLKAVARLGVGLDNIDVSAARARNVQVMWPRGANAVAVAEFVIAALFLLFRNLAAASEHVRQGGWSRLEFGGRELWGQSLGLVGLGEVGVRVATRARALGMRVFAYDPARLPSESAVEELGIRMIDLASLLAESDIVSLHAPLTAETRNLLNEKTLALMRPGSCVINTARGSLIDHEALAASLKAGHLAGAVLDVTDPEPLPMGHSLREAPNVWLTPHVGGLTREAQNRVTNRVVGEIRRMFETRM